MTPFQSYLKPNHVLAASEFRTLVSRMEAPSARSATKDQVLNDLEAFIGSVTEADGFDGPAAAARAYATLRLARSGRCVPAVGEEWPQMLLRMLGARNTIEAQWARSQATAAKYARGPFPGADAAFAPHSYGAGAALLDGAVPPYALGSAAAFGGGAFPADEPPRCYGCGGVGHRLTQCPSVPQPPPARGRASGAASPAYSRAAAPRGGAPATSHAGSARVPPPAVPLFREQHHGEQRGEPQRGSGPHSYRGGAGTDAGRGRG